MIRVSFTSLVEYKAKSNRHRASQNSPIELPSSSRVLRNAEKLEMAYPNGSASLTRLLNPVDASSDLSGYEPIDTQTIVEEQAAAKKSIPYRDFKSSLDEYMDTVALRLIEVSSMNRYTRKLPDEGLLP